MALIQTIRYLKQHPLASRNFPVALGRYFRWQLGTRILNQRMIMPFVGDSVLVVRRGMTGATGNLYAGLHDFHEMSLLLHFLRPGDTFVDVGANVGAYTVLASGVVGARSFAFEPVPQTFECLRDNLRINGIEDRVVALQMAVGADADEVSFSSDLDTQNRVVNSRYQGGMITTPQITLDSVIHNAHPTMWKLDVEGFEENVLSGATNSIRDPSLSVVLIEGRSELSTRLLRENGFSEAFYDGFTRRISHRLSPADGFCNHIWVRDVENVQKLCRSGPRFTILNIEV